MPISKDVKNWVKSSDFTGAYVEDGANVYVPTTKYPHVHLNKSFVTFSKNKSKDYLITGDIVSDKRITKVMEDYDNADVLTVCQYILDNYV